MANDESNECYLRSVVIKNNAYDIKVEKVDIVIE